MRTKFVCAFLFLCALTVDAQVQPRPPGSSQITGVSGNGHTLATVSGALTQGDGVTLDAFGNFMDTGSPAASGGSVTFPTNPQTATYQVLAADFASCKTITVASGTFTITLVASGSQPANGQCLDIINYGTGVVTIARSGQNINGGTASLSLAAGSATAPTGAHIVSDGTNYQGALWGGSSGGGISGLTTNKMSKATSGTAIGDSSVTDNGTTVTTADAGGYVGPSYTANGTTAGFSDYPQGADSGSVAPCNTANSICEEAPTSVTAYRLIKPAAQPPSGLNFYWCTSANPTVCSFVAPSWNMLVSATAGLTLNNGTNATTFNQSSAVTWKWANTTAATSSVNQSSPIASWCGQAWEGGTSGDTQDCTTAQLTFSGANPNPAPLFTVGDSTGSSKVASGTWFGLNMYYDPSHLATSIGSARPVTSTANYQVAVGDSAGSNTGAGNVAVGHGASGNGTADSNTVAIGYIAGCTTCTGSVMIGFGTTGGTSTYGVAIGDGITLGNFVGDVMVGTGNATPLGNYDVQVGYSNTTAGANDDIIGQGITADQANEAILGNTSVTKTILQGAVVPGIVYSAAGTALPSCVTGLKGGRTVVSDATSPTFLGAYTSGGAVVSPVMCNGSGWVTY